MSVAEQNLQEFVLSRRWFRSKARGVASSRIHDTLDLPGANGRFIVFEIAYAEGDRDLYLLTLSDAKEEVEDALQDPAFTAALLAAIGQELELRGQCGSLRASHTDAFAAIAGPRLNLQGRLSKAEQSNSAIIYDDRLFLKLFRKLDPGVNPDFEVGRFLTERGFSHTPAVAGHIEYRMTGVEPMSAGLLLQFVPNQGDAWEYTLREAGRYFETVRPEATPAIADIGTYIDSARRLGQITAAMHVVLAAPDGGPEFNPEPFSDEFRTELHHELIAQMETTIELLRAKEAFLKGSAAEDARKLLASESKIRTRFMRACENAIHALRIRHHGDFHLGQVLYTGSDFMIIDFEGEPARSLAARHMKRCALRDVAGMIRSFQYAAWWALRARHDAAEESRARQAEFWANSVSTEYSKAYFAVAGRHDFIPTDPQERKALLDVFLLEKALYEVAYELNNRPDWVDIPVRSLVRLIETTD